MTTEYLNHPKEAEETKNSRKGEKTELAYSIEEWEKVAGEFFGVKPECVIAALLEAGVEKATEEEAKNIVMSFLKREVH